MKKKRVLKQAIIAILFIAAMAFANDLTNKDVKAEITVSNPKTDYVIKQNSNIYTNKGKRTDFKTRGKMRGKSVPTVTQQLATGKFIKVLNSKTINGKKYYRIASNRYVRQNNVLAYTAMKQKIAAEEEDPDYELTDDEADASFLIDDLDNGFYKEDPSYYIFDDSGYHNRIIKKARGLLGYFTYGTGKYRTAFGNWRHPRKHGRTDCSGFVWLVMKRAGYRVGNWPFFTAPMERDAKHSHRYLRKIRARDIRPGDIVIANTGSGLGNDGHAAIVDGKYDGLNTQIIEMGGDNNGHVHRSTLGNSLSLKLIKGRITYARAK